jgi:cystathionine gamma-synthase
VTFSSGMAAVAAVLERLPLGAVVVAPTVAYMGVRDLLAERDAAGRLSVRLVDVTDTDAVLAACAGAALLWIESPTNPLLDVADVPALCAGARRAGALSVVDNTLASPVLQRPLELGADVVVHSATKFIGGHSDLLMGAAVAADPELARELLHARETMGATPGALEAFLALRGVRTLPLRVRRAQESAGELAHRLRDHPEVTAVRYPGLTDDPGYERARRHMDGPGAMVAFEVRGGAARADAVCAAVEVFSHATSLGGVESLIERRARYPQERVVPEALLRASVGCEHHEDLWRDLEGALAATAAGAGAQNGAYRLSHAGGPAV